MVLKNLFRRKTRTLLTILGIGIGVAAIIAMGALAGGLKSGYSSMLTGSKADLILSQPNSMDISFSSIDESIGEKLAAAPEVSTVSGMLQGFSQTEGEPFFFVFGYPQDSFLLDRFQIIDGEGLHSRAARTARGKPLLLGSAASEVLDKTTGDSLRLAGSVFRIVGIYQTGDAFEDSGALLALEDAQELLAKPRQVSVFYIQLKDLSLKDRFMARVERLWPDLSLSGSAEFYDKQLLLDILDAYVWVIGGLAIIIGGVGMMNAQLMAVFERIREIGVLRAVGWSSWRVLRMILGESVLVSLAGGLIGVVLGYSIVHALSKVVVFMRSGTVGIGPALLGQAFLVVFLLGLIGGSYPAWWASRLQPVEALRFEGGSSGAKVQRLPVGGMAVQSLWQRSTRTLLTLGAIGITVGSIMALQGIIAGFTTTFTDMVLGTDVEVMIRQADISDTSLSAIDERVGDKIAALPEIEHVSGMLFTAIVLPEAGNMLIVQGYSPNEFAIQRFKIVEGERLTSNHQIIIGQTTAQALNKRVGNTIEISGTRFRIVGLYETGIGWEEMGAVLTLRDAQALMGRPRKVSMYAVKLKDAGQAEAIVQRLNSEFPEVHASVSGEFAQQLPDMQTANGMINGISFLAILIGGVGVLNTMLMAVFERTREIGVLRALGWRRRSILLLILREALYLGLLGGIAGIGIALGLTSLSEFNALIGTWIDPIWSWDIFTRAIVVAALLGLLGGLYPAYRATRLQPVEAIRYE